MWPAKTSPLEDPDPFSSKKCIQACPLTTWSWDSWLPRSRVYLMRVALQVKSANWRLEVWEATGQRVLASRFAFAAPVSFVPVSGYVPSASRLPLHVFFHTRAPHAKFEVRAAFLHSPLAFLPVRPEPSADCRPEGEEELVAAAIHLSIHGKCLPAL